MKEITTKPLTPITHSHPTGKRCCGRPLDEKCSPEEEADKVNPQTGEKSCCKGKH